MISIYNAIGIILKWKKFNCLLENNISRNSSQIILGVLESGFWGCGCPDDTQTPCWLGLYLDLPCPACWFTPNICGLWRFPSGMSRTPGASWRPRDPSFIVAGRKKKDTAKILGNLWYFNNYNFLWVDGGPCFMIVPTEQSNSNKIALRKFFEYMGHFVIIASFMNWGLPMFSENTDKAG